MPNTLCTPSARSILTMTSPPLISDMLSPACHPVGNGTLDPARDAAWREPAHPRGEREHPSRLTRGSRQIWQSPAALDALRLSYAPKRQQFVRAESRFSANVMID